MVTRFKTFWGVLEGHEIRDLAPLPCIVEGLEIRDLLRLRGSRDSRPSDMILEGHEIQDPLAPKCPPGKGHEIRDLLRPERGRFLVLQWARVTRFETLLLRWSRDSRPYV